MSGKYGLIVRTLTIMGFLAFLAGCKTAGMPSFSSFLKPQPGFSDYLARGYRMLAEYEDYLEQDQRTARYFETKAELASSGETVEPGTTDDKNLTASVRGELDAARGTLITALANRDKISNAVKLAEAQVNFDCWLMRAAKRDEAARWCQDTYYNVIGNLDVATDTPRSFSVYFTSGKATPDADALQVIRQAAYAHALHEEWPVFLTGYSDKSGDKQSNQILSMRRALAVRNALAQYGVDPDKVTIDAFGEEQSGTADAEARRVDITIEPAFRHRGAGTSHIEDIAPHYFSD